MDALELLHQDHVTVRGLFDEFDKAKDASETARVRDVTRKIIEELDTHTRIEEDIFYPAVRDAGGEELAGLVAEGIEEHHVVKGLIEEVQGLEADDEAYQAKVTVITENVRHHAGEEEQEMFPKVREVMDASAREEIGGRLEEAKAQP